MISSFPVSLRKSISGTKLTVAIISNQKKKLYLKSSITIVVKMISEANNTIDKVKRPKNIGSELLEKDHRRMSSPISANRVTVDIVIVTNVPSRYAMSRFLMSIYFDLLLPIVMPIGFLTDWLFI